MLLQETAVAPMATPPPATSDAECIRAAIAHLSPTARDLLVLRFREDSSVAELAAVTGMTPMTVKQRLHRAAWVVEDLVGLLPPAAEHMVAPGRSRPAELAEEEALLGITPVLAARFVAAVGGDTVPAADERWRWHALLGALRQRGDVLLTGLVTVVVVLPAVASIAG